MAAFPGHVCPGIGLIILGTWWAFNAWRGYIRSRARKRPYVSRPWYPLPGISRVICLEGHCKIFLCLMGLAAEIITGLEDGQFVYVTNYHHGSMYVFYATSGIIDVMTNWRLPLPEDSDYVGILLAVVVEWLLFNFHLHGRAHLDILVHTMLMYVIAAKAACIALEMIRRNSVLASLGRAFFCLLHGTWLCQVGFILYSPLPSVPPWDEHSHKDMIVAAAVFTWHMWGLLVYLTVIGFVTWVLCSTCDCEDASDRLDEVRYALVSDSVASVDGTLGGEDKTANLAIGDYADDECFV